MDGGKIDKKLAGIFKIYGAKTDKLRREKGQIMAAIDFAPIFVKLQTI